MNLLDNPAYAEFDRLNNFLYSVAWFCGAHKIFLPNYRVNWTLYVCAMVVLNYMSMSVYTLFFFSGDIFKQLQTVCVYGLVMTGAYKLSRVYAQPLGFAQVLAIVRHVYRCNSISAAGHRRQFILCEHTANTWRITHFMVASTAVAIGLYVCHPVYSLVWHGEKVLIMNMVVPFVDHETNGGFALTMAVQCLSSVFGIAGNLCIDLFVQVCVCSESSMIALLADSMRELGDAWQSGRQTRAFRRRYLRNIMHSFRELDEYIARLNSTLGHTILCQVSAMSISMVLCLFCITVNNWVGGTGFMAFALIMLMSLCSMGTIQQSQLLSDGVVYYRKSLVNYTYQNAEMCAVIYATKWYLFPVEDQRDILILLERSQSAREMWIGKLAPLNVESGMQILKAIYQLFMMMLEFL